MDDVRLVKISRFLSKHLRHDPGGLGLTLAPGGWVLVDTLLAACAGHRMPFTRAELEEVVAKNSKQRFSFDADGTSIRANQGHSVEVDLQLAPATPPAVLYHGTGHQTAPIIAQDGLRKWAATMSICPVTPAQRGQSGRVMVARSSSKLTRRRWPLQAICSTAPTTVFG